MIPYQGKYGKASVMLTQLNDQNTISQIYEFLNHPAFTNPISIMPDCHYGAGAVIGFTMEMTDMIIPNIVGVDINCGMLSLYLGPNALAQLSKEDIDKQIRARIPFSTGVHPLTDSGYTMLDQNFWNWSQDYHLEFTKQYNKRYGTRYDPVKFDMKWFEDKCVELDRVDLLMD